MRARRARGLAAVLPESWDDDAASDEVAAAAIRRRRQRARIPDDVRHTEKWRLALEMIQR